MRDDRYTMFRNFMTNELKVTRDDIEVWTKEAVRQEVQKLVGQIPIEKLATAAVRDWTFKTELRKEIGKLLAERLIIGEAPPKWVDR